MMRQAGWLMIPRFFWRLFFWPIHEGSYRLARLSGPAGRMWPSWRFRVVSVLITAPLRRLSPPWRMRFGLCFGIFWWFVRRRVCLGGRYLLWMGVSCLRTPRNDGVGRLGTLGGSSRSLRPRSGSFLRSSRRQTSGRAQDPDKESWEIGLTENGRLRDWRKRRPGSESG